MINYYEFETLLREKGVNATTVSRETGVARSVLTDWKKGRYTPKIETLQKLADYFNVDINWFLNRDSETKEKKYKYTYTFQSHIFPEFEMQLRTSFPVKDKDFQDIFEFYIKMQFRDHPEKVAEIERKQAEEERKEKMKQKKQIK